MEKLDLVNDKVDILMEKLDRVVETIASVDKTLVRNTASLEYHIARTDALEDKVDPLVKHVTKVEFFVRLGPVLLGLAAAAYYIVSIVTKL